jgi:hypothetical protein
MKAAYFLGAAVTVNKAAAPGLKKPFSQAMIPGAQVPIDQPDQN